MFTRRALISVARHIVRELGSYANVIRLAEHVAKREDLRGIYLRFCREWGLMRTDRRGTFRGSSPADVLMSAVVASLNLSESQKIAEIDEDREDDALVSALDVYERHGEALKAWALSLRRAVYRPAIGAHFGSDMILSLRSNIK